jgi:hypothetical protein
MKKTFTLLTATIFTFCNAVAQQPVNIQVSNATHSKIEKVDPISEEPTSQKRKCATNTTKNEAFETWIQKEIEKNEQFANGKKAAVVYTIPIIFHIIHTGQTVGTGRNISLTQINSQITRLNEDYRKLNADRTTYLTQPALVAVAGDMEINFCAAKVSPTGASLAEAGVDRILASSKGWTNPPYSGMSNTYLEGTVKPASIWDPTKYFNVWVAEFNDGVLGYAQFPVLTGGNANTDGVVLDYKFTGVSGIANAPYNLGRTLTHEAGHWLGLFHIWGDDGGACSGTDNITDTPNQAGENYTCPAAGSVKTDGCTAASPGVLYQNYMDYSDDKCMVMFTAGQKVRMQYVMANCIRRKTLNTSYVCSSVGINETVSNLEISLFPNPSNGELNVTVDLLNSEDFTISVINTLGQVVKEVNQLHSNGGTVKLDLSLNSNGVYYVTVKTKSGSKTKRFILQ